MDIQPSLTLSEDEKTALRAFLSYHYGNYRYLQEQWSVSVLPFEQWIVTLGIEKLWAMYIRASNEKGVS